MFSLRTKNWIGTRIESNIFVTYDAPSPGSEQRPDGSNIPHLRNRNEIQRPGEGIQIICAFGRPKDLIASLGIESFKHEPYLPFPRRDDLVDAGDLVVKERGDPPLLIFRRDGHTDLP